MSDRLPVYGFLGTNPCTPEQIASNLADTLPEEAIFLIPDDISKGKASHLGLRLVRDWLLREYDEEDTESSADILESLQEFQERGHEVYLVLLRMPDSEADTQLWALAHAFNIPVMDLAQNMYMLGDPVPEEPEPAPEPRTRGVPRELPIVAPEPEAEQETAPPPVDIPAEEILSTDKIAGTLITLIRQIVRQELETMALIPGVNKPPVVERTLVDEEDSPPWEQDLLAGKAGAGPAPDQVDEPRYKYTRDEEGFYRPRRPGRLRKGLEQVMLTETELANLRSEGKVIE